MIKRNLLAVSLAQDLEPEYLAISHGGNKDHSVECYGLDASNSDSEINFQSPSAGTCMPDAIDVCRVKGRTDLKRPEFAFVGLERIGGVMIFDVSDPKNPRYVSYTNNRGFLVDDVINEDAGDLEPEGLLSDRDWFLTSKTSP